MRILRSDILENLWMALQTLRANKLRSFLTVIGVMIGVITVMLIASIISGIDVVAAVAMGARACLVARTYCYGLMAGGERGVQRAADILRTEIVRTMALLGACSVGDLTPERVRLRP